MREGGGGRGEGGGGGRGGGREGGEGGGRERVWEGREILLLTMTFHPFHRQAQYNLLCRSTEWEIMEVCKREGVACLPWSPLKGYCKTLHSNITEYVYVRVSWVRVPPEAANVF